MKKKLFVAAIAATTAVSALAGGLLTNTNQSIAFLRNPARDGAIGIDGIYSNPAGVMFLDNGFHLSVNWQAAFQTRTIETTNQMLMYGAQNNGATTKTFKGDATAPFIPSIQAAYNTDKWSFQFGFAVTGGGGKCTFDNGLGSFETAVGSVGYQLMNAAESLNAGFNQIGQAVPGITSVPNVVGYDCNSWMEGKQFYFGFTLGAAYKINEHLSVYGGVRALYGNASYKAKIDNIKVMTDKGAMTLPEYVGAVQGGLMSNISTVQQTKQYAMGQYVAAAMGMGMSEADATAWAAQQPTIQQLSGAEAQLMGAAASLSAQAEDLTPYHNGINLQSDQDGLGFAPIIGIDFKTERFNLAAKYEFRTAMRMKNTSTVKESSKIAAVNQFQDGLTIREDQPAMLAIGAEWKALDNLRINLGYHHFFDKDAKKTWCYLDDKTGSVIIDDCKNKQLSGGTNEFLGGIEWDATSKWTFSTGFQITRYGLTDDYMNDMSFVVNSWSFGLGAKYQINDKVAVQAAYFQTNYGHYKTDVVLDERANPVTNDFTRTNKVVGVGVDFKF